MYEGIDRVTHKPRTIPLTFHTIQIDGVVDVKKPKTYRDKAITYNASKLTSLGKIGWLIEKGDDLISVSTEPIYSITMKEDIQVLCLNISSGTTCDKLFIVPKESGSSVVAKIVSEQDAEKPKQYSFRLDDKVVKTGEITGYKWMIDNNIVSTEESFTYTFPDY